MSTAFLITILLISYCAIELSVIIFDDLLQPFLQTRPNAHKIILIYHYIRLETMKRAMQFLSADHLSIRDIAERCGYKNAAAV
jgi:AraC-like DNA-binding protein